MRNTRNTRNLQNLQNLQNLWNPFKTRSKRPSNALNVRTLGNLRRQVPSLKGPQYNHCACRKADMPNKKKKELPEETVRVAGNEKGNVCHPRENGPTPQYKTEKKNTTKNTRRAVYLPCPRLSLGHTEKKRKKKRQHKKARKH